MIRVRDFHDLLHAALDILGDGAGRVELTEGKRRVRVGRLLTQSPADVDLGLGGGIDAPAAPAIIEAVIVRAPSVGVVSFQDNRTGRPLVEVGQPVVSGQTLAFITAMDVTTKVTATRVGIVEEVFVEDGDGVEYNAPLLKILPAG